MFLTTTRRADQVSQALMRLRRTMPDATPPDSVDRDLAPDQKWIEPDSPNPGTDPRGDPWWRRSRPGRLVERWLPGADPPVRRVSLGLVVALALALAVAVALALSLGGEPEPPPGLPVAQTAPHSPSPTELEPGSVRDTGSIVVSVVGLVVRPGLVTLPDGARVADALAAAGGPVPGVDVNGLNIARRLSDGEQINVGVPAPSGPAAADAADPPGKVDLNSASPAQLDSLPGVGAVTAQRIVDWRTRHGRFTRVEQLREIDGMGPARYGQIKDLVVVR